MNVSNRAGDGYGRGRALTQESQLSSKWSKARRQSTQPRAILAAKCCFYGVGDAGFEPATSAV